MSGWNAIASRPPVYALPVTLQIGIQVFARHSIRSVDANGAAIMVRSRTTTAARNEDPSNIKFFAKDEVDAARLG